MTTAKKKAKLEVAQWKLGIHPRAREMRKRFDPDKFNEWYMEELAKVPFKEALDEIEQLWGILDFAETIGDRIKAIRKYYMLTQAELAKLLDVKQASVSRWEKNKAEPGEEMFQKLADMVELNDPSFLRYGNREPTSSGELIPERPVRVIGELMEDGSIRQYPASERTLNVERPREGRPHKDVVGIMIYEAGRVGMFQGDWTMFYRAELHDEAALYRRKLCITKIRGDDTLKLRIIVDRTDKGQYVLASPHGALTYENDVEWVSPILSFRQELYSV